MNGFWKTMAMAWKEWQVFAKDRGNLFLIFLLPLLIASLLASIWSGGGDIHLPVIVVNQDSGKYSEDVLDILRDIEDLDLMELEGEETVVAQISAGEVVAAVFIPADFSAQIDAYEQTEIQVMLDPGQAEYGSIITSVMEEVVEVATIQGEMKHGMDAVMVDVFQAGPADPSKERAANAQQDGVMNTQVKRMIDDPPVAVQKEDLEGAAVQAPDNMFSMFVPGFTVMFAFFLVPTLAVELLREKEIGSLRRLIAAPMPRYAIVGGKVLAYTFVVMLQVGVIFGVSSLIFKMPLGNSLLGLLVITVALGFAATSLGMMVAGLTRSMSQAGSIGVLMVFVLGALGGSIQMGLRPLYRAEGFIGFVSRLTPHAHALEGYLRLLVEEARFVDVLTQIATLLLMGLIFFLIAVWRFRFE